MAQIILARAGSTDFDDQERIIGDLDLPINTRGQAELNALSAEWKALPLATLYASAGESARQSAQLLGKRLGVKVRVLPDLKNLNFGLWQGLVIDEVRRKHPKLFKQWEENPRSVSPPAGETVDEVLERVPRAIRPALRRRRGAVVVLFAPDPLLKILRAYLVRSNLDDIQPHEPSPPWELLEYDPNLVAS